MTKNGKGKHLREPMGGANRYVKLYPLTSEPVRHFNKVAENCPQFEWYRECKYCIYTRLKAKIALGRLLLCTQKNEREGDTDMMDATKYKVGYFPVPDAYSTWVKKDHIEKPPIWCSVDMRDGNQSLVIPMSLEEKLEYFKVLLEVGFQEIELGFPASSETEY